MTKKLTVKELKKSRKLAAFTRAIKTDIKWAFTKGIRFDAWNGAEILDGKFAPIKQVDATSPCVCAIGAVAIKRVRPTSLGSGQIGAVARHFGIDEKNRRLGFLGRN